MFNHYTDVLKHGNSSIFNKYKFYKQLIIKDMASVVKIC